MKKPEILIIDHRNDGERDYSDFGSDCTPENIERVHINRVIRKRFEETRKEARKGRED